MMIKGC